MMEIHSFLLEIMLLIGAWLCLALLQKDRGTAGRKTFTLATLAWMGWCFGQLAGARGWLDPPAAARVAHISGLLLAPLFLGVAAQSARLEIARRVPWFPLTLLAPGLLTTTMLFSDRWRGLFLIASADGTTIAGPLWRVMTLYDFALMLTGCAILITTALRWERPGDGARRFAIGVAPLVTLVGGGAYLAGLWELPANPTPLLLGITFVILQRGVFAGGLLQPLPISQHALIQQLPVGIVLTDRRGVVVDINRVAEQRLQIVATAAIGRNVDAVIEAAGVGVDYEISPVKSAGTEAGQIVLLDPPIRKPASAREILADTPTAERPPASDPRD